MHIPSHLLTLAVFSALYGVLTLGLSAMPAHAGEDFEMSGYVEPELRLFTANASQTRQRDVDASIAGEVTIKYFWDNNDQSLIVTPFARIATRDNHRSHWDMREARYNLYRGNWELGLGIDKVFWGVTEAVHLVDVINQTDWIEDPVKQEAKLGLAMLRLRTRQDFGTFEAFLLPGFRELNYTGPDGRPATDLPVDQSLTRYESSKDARHIDYALRYSNSFGIVDMGLAYFDGTNRTPLLQPALSRDGDLVLAPYYTQMKQVSLDLQATKGAWLYKLEGYTRHELGDNYQAATGGIEYTFYGIGGSDSDLGLVAEYAIDTRGINPRNPYQNDGFLALRWAANDTASTSLLGGVDIDAETGALAFRFKGQRRLDEDYRLSLEAYVFQNVPAKDVVSNIADDDYIQLRLARYF
ncbi:MAG: hypothetical protein GC184_04235 [Rhizobiales bacterium]|nr:hypothetical protein [Hyphomicrobiales bacterium]